MQPAQNDHAEDNRLRIVFDDGVLSFSFGANATFEDISPGLSALSIQRYGLGRTAWATTIFPPAVGVCAHDD